MEMLFVRGDGVILVRRSLSAHRCSVQYISRLHICVGLTSIAELDVVCDGDRRVIRSNRAPAFIFLRQRTSH
jgi:hypothetical protein